MGRASGERRQFLLGAASAGASLLVIRREGLGHAKPGQDEDVSPTEDLMREHGVLRRLLLIYREVIRRVETNQPFKPELIVQSAHIIRAFIEDYHEKDEEEFLFPRFQKAGKLTDLVDVLLQQHQAGRKLTADILRLASTTTSTASSRQQLAQSMRLFVRMYEAHSAREDTVLFPAFNQLIGEKELHKVQKLFEQKEKALPTGDFEKMVADVTGIEQAMGIYDLAQLTPKP